MSVLQGTRDALDGYFKLIVVAPVFVYDAEGGVCRSVESFFNVVVPNQRSANNRDDPESFALITVRMLLPFLGLDLDRAPYAELLDCHARDTLGDARLNR